MKQIIYDIASEGHFEGGNLSDAATHEFRRRILAEVDGEIVTWLRQAGRDLDPDAEDNWSSAIDAAARAIEAGEHRR